MTLSAKQIKQWSNDIKGCLIRDRYFLQQKLNKIKFRQSKKQAVDRLCQELEQKIATSLSLVETRSKSAPTLNYPEQLPVSTQADKIKKAINDHQVIIVAGETGSGKTTQLPKMLLELGYGIRGQIGHTQPRRLAARSVAARIAEELNEPLGQCVGFKVRFNEAVSKHSRVKLMTDGVLLNEIHHDKYLNAYDAIIIDEAHERSLNIDFLLGYLHNLIKKRKDLKIIITSATIDPEKFSRHFSNAPIIEVSGRTYPVEVIYHDYDEENEELNDALCKALDELNAFNGGDTLVFLSSEREIRDAEKHLKKAFERTEVLPLFSRLSQQDQNKIFHPGSKQRIILSTNVAETSITVPRIKNVIDAGHARISRYSYRNKIQRLPIEKISQASANQRKGRCGRLEDGVCIRLYSEEDFLEREEFTDPEILRTNLASVILQMAHLDLGDLETFPFIDPPDSRSIRDGKRLLHEIGALDDKEQITKIGRQVARLAIEPRFARMLIEANRLGVLQEVLIIVAGISIQDIRERPAGKEQKADESHARFDHEVSDFMSVLNVWNYLQTERKELSNNQFRKRIQNEYLNFMRWREWLELYQQLKEQCLELKFRLNGNEGSHDSIHQALLSGLLSHIAQLTPDGDYKGARNIRFLVFPGSAQFKRKHPWIVAGEIVETSKLYGRTVAKIDPQWLPELATHLVKLSYLEPTWSKKRGFVQAKEIQNLYGLIISADRYVNYGKIEPVVAREIFIREGLIAGKLNQRFTFIAKNHKLIEEVRAIEEKTRRRDLLVEEAVLFDFYHQRLPKDICSVADLSGMLKKRKELNEQLLLTKDFILKQRIEHDVEAQFPTVKVIGGQAFPLHYKFEPGSRDDGVSIEIPIAALNRIREEHLERLVPGLLEEKVTAMIRGLPKATRKNFVPVPDYAAKCMEALKLNDDSLINVISKALFQASEYRVPLEELEAINLDPHFKMNIIVLDNEGKELARGRDVEHLKTELSDVAKQSTFELGDSFNRLDIKTWEFGELPDEYCQEVAGHKVRSYPTLSYHDDQIDLLLEDDERSARLKTQRGLRRLVMLQLGKELNYLKKNIPHLKEMAFACAHMLTKQALIAGISEAAVRDAMPQKLPKNEKEFNSVVAAVKGKLMACTNEIAQNLYQVFKQLKDVQKSLGKVGGLGNINAVNDIKAHISTLFFDDFIWSIEPGRLSDYLRYIKGLDVRVERLALNPAKDLAQISSIEVWQERIESMLKRREFVYWDESWNEFFWMVEEYRLSLFAQGVKTAFPISQKRLTKYWQTLPLK